MMPIDGCRVMHRVLISLTLPTLIPVATCRRATCLAPPIPMSTSLSELATGRPVMAGLKPEPWPIERSYLERCAQPPGNRLIPYFWPCSGDDVRARGRTHVVKRTLAPEWGTSLEFPWDESDESAWLALICWDHNKVGERRRQQEGGWGRRRSWRIKCG